jgi:hypothetical protein
MKLEDVDDSKMIGCLPRYISSTRKRTVPCRLSGGQSHHLSACRTRSKRNLSQREDTDVFNVMSRHPVGTVNCKGNIEHVVQLTVNTTKVNVKAEQDTVRSNQRVCTAFNAAETFTMDSAISPIRGTSRLEFASSSSSSRTSMEPFRLSINPEALEKVLLEVRGDLFMKLRVSFDRKLLCG